MGKSLFSTKVVLLFLPAILVMILLSACSSTKSIPEGQYLIWKNKLTLNSDKVMVNKGEIKDNLDHLIIQKPNSNYLDLSPVKVPYKLWKYNRRYKKLTSKPDSLLPKSVERPVLLDTSTIARSAQNMRNYLFNQGYFYAKVYDTVTYKNKKAIVTYKVNAGSNYIINKINYKIDDSYIKAVVLANRKGASIEKGKEFTYVQLEEERSRLTSIINNHGFRRFTLENITFKIDTMEKSMFRVASSPFENAVNFIAQTKSNRKSTIDIDVVIRKAEDTLAYNKFIISAITVYPDDNGVNLTNKKDMIVKKIGGIEFRYHYEYVHPKVLYEHIFMNTGGLYSKENEDKTTAKLGELGIFQYIKVQARENRSTRDSVEYSIYLNKAQKHDFNTKYEISSGTTYFLGNSLSASYRNTNFMKGANLLSIGVNGGLETTYDDAIEGNLLKKFKLLTMYYGINASLDFPKFLAPVPKSIFSRSNLPHTIISAGENVIDRVDYFKLANSSYSFSYNWHETDIKTWSFSPAFVNVIRVPYISPGFQTILDANQYLKNSYKKTFIEGENISYKIDNNAKKHGINYSYIRLALEEAGGIVGAVNKFGAAVYGFDTIPYAQYTKFDFDARHYFTVKHSVFAFRLYGGIGTPYGRSQSLPYIKQYFVGGPYSMRGWRIRTLGPGSFADTTNTFTNLIDRTGDIKIELNGEYRFPVAPLFAGAVKMNGAIFADAGNMWLSKTNNDDYPGGEFAFNKLGQDIAMDLGLGSRFDIASFLTFRVDVAMPVKKPYIHSNSGWVFNAIDFNNSTWRKENIILNISIGYPF
jgi:outer membrane protein insertion porin family